MSGGSPCNINELEEIARITGERIENEHRLDSLYMLTYTILLALSVLTIWLFKHRRFRYVHETGLSVIYGLIVGAIFRFGVEERTFTTTVYDLPPQSNSCSIRLPPEKAILHLAIYAETNVSRYYHYSLTGESQNKESSHYRMTFNPEIFFNVILPPIIFSAGYSMKRRHFFKNFGAISMFAFLGTLISAVVIAIICYGLSRIVPSLSESLKFSDCIYFGSIISATDPVTVLAIFNDLNVDVDLYALVFGESVLNDAVAITMSQSVDRYGSYRGSYSGAALLSSIGDFAATFAGSFALGTSVGCFTALLTKYTHVRDYPLLETVLFVLLSYSTFFLSEAIGFTGIVALLFCGVTQAHYTYNNLSQESQVWTKQVFELLNFLSENFVFAYIGVSTFSFRSHYWSVAFIFIAIFACALSRASAIYPLAALINCTRSNFCTSGCKRRSGGLSIGDYHTGATASATTGGGGGGGLSPSFKWQRFNGPSGGDNNSDLTNPVETAGTSGSAAVALIRSSQPDNNLIGFNKQHMLVFCGLRGAMAFSLAIRNTSTTVRQMFFSTTIVIVMITVFVGGCLSLSMLQWLKIQVQSTNENVPGTDASSPTKKRAPAEKAHRRSFWHCFDTRYMKPLLTHSGPLLSENLPRCCLPLADWLTTADQRRNVMAGYVDLNFEVPGKNYHHHQESSATYNTASKFTLPFGEVLASSVEPEGPQLPAVPPVLSTDPPQAAATNLDDPYAL